MLRVYLDNCILSRPFDDQGSARVKSETEAILKIRSQVEALELDLVWSYLIEFEVSQNPFERIRESAFQWREFANVIVEPSIKIVRQSLEFRDLGIKPVDSLHLAAAFEAKSDYFVTADDGILLKLKVHGSMVILGPVDFIKKVKVR